jgi:glycogen synthase
MKIVYILSESIFSKGSYENSLKHILFHFNKKNDIFPIIPDTRKISPIKSQVVYENTEIIFEKKRIIEDSLDYYFVKNLKSHWDFHTVQSIKLFSEVIAKYINDVIVPDVVHIFGFQFGYLAKLLNPNIKKIFNIRKIEAENTLIKSKNDLEEIESLPPLFYGTIYSNAVVLTSKRIINEIMSGEIESDLREIILKRYKNVFGLVNGIDYGIWNPKHDYYIKHNFSDKEVFNKNLCKSKMQKFLNLEVDNSLPLFIFGENLNSKSGFDVIKSQLDYLSKMNLQLIIFGEPEKRYLYILKDLENKYSNIRFVLRPNEKQIHRLISSSDIYISTAEVNFDNYFHLKAMRYGVVPFTYNTGIYADTIVTKSESFKNANGFLYFNKDSASFISRLKEVIDIFKDKPLWNSYLLNAMKKDFSWKEVLNEYEDLYLRKI